MLNKSYLYPHYKRQLKKKCIKLGKTIIAKEKNSTNLLTFFFFGKKCTYIHNVVYTTHEAILKHIITSVKKKIGKKWMPSLMGVTKTKKKSEI